MTQPVWVTPAGSLGTVPEGIFYSTPVQATAGASNVYFKLIAGHLPDGIQVTSNGLIVGTPKNVLNVQGVPAQVNRDVTSKFAVRAYTTKIVGGVTVVDRLADRTFTITVTGQNPPEWITTSGNIGTYDDGTEVTIKLQYTDPDPGDQVTVSVISGSLPQGLTLSPTTGIISGVIAPISADASGPVQFTLGLSDTKSIGIRTFNIYVYAKSSMIASTTYYTADNDWITADTITAHTPILLTPSGNLGRVRADNFYAFKFDAVDIDNDPINYSITLGEGIGFDSGVTIGSEGSYDHEAFDRGNLALPPGLTIDPITGWFYGYIPNQGVTEQTYKFAVRVYKVNDPTVISEYRYFTITIVGNIETDVTWLTPSDLGTINNGSVSTLFVSAVNTGGRSLQYRLAPGSNSKLPQGLTLQPSGNITGRVSFNGFCLDGGTTTFDKNLNTRLNIDETTFDSKFDFTVNAYAAQTDQLGYQVGGIRVINGGSGYTGNPIITISAPPAGADAIPATAGVATIVNGVITQIALGNPGRGYTKPPQVTITGGGGVGATAETSIIESTAINAVSVLRQFSITVNRAFNQPYETLYIKAMPPFNNRAIISQLIQNQDIIPNSLVYRADDPNFGVAKSVVYDHAYGLGAASLDLYVQSLNLNHYLKTLTLGEIKTAQALDSSGNVVYEIVYSEVIDNLVNNQGESVGKEVTLAYPVRDNTISTVYPNSLVDMRTQVIDTVGQVSPALPLWMTSKQTNGRVLGFTPAWIIAYVQPGNSGLVAYNIRTKLGTALNVIDYDVDRYELDRSQTYNWDPATQKWLPYPAEATTFDHDTTEFDGGSVTFIAPADRWPGTDEFDKYLVFPKRTILG